MAVHPDALPQHLQALLADLVKAVARPLMVVPPLDAHQLNLSALHRQAQTQAGRHEQARAETGRHRHGLQTSWCSRWVQVNCARGRSRKKSMGVGTGRSHPQCMVNSKCMCSQHDNQEHLLADSCTLVAHTCS